MANTCTILRNIERISQRVANFITRPGSLTRTAANTLINDIELLRGAVRELPLMQTPKNDIQNRLAQAQRLLRNGSLSISKINRVLATLSVLQVVTTKVQSRPVPCTQGLTIVHPSGTFSTICQLCR